MKHRGPISERRWARSSARRVLVLAIAATALAAAPASASATPGEDAVVVAVIDRGLDVWLEDFEASSMPQHLDSDPVNDLPLDRPAREWLSGFPSVFSFASVRETISPAQSTAEEIHLGWVRDTKIVGLVDFGNAKLYQPAAPPTHGTLTTVMAVGNETGACPECLLVFVNLPACTACAEADEALAWVNSQPWIDVVSNSYGFSTVLALDERAYDESDTEAQRLASERGQTIFFSAGNGMPNTVVSTGTADNPAYAHVNTGMLIPNTTYLSSQEGPDWIVTVAAVTPEGRTITGTGKPADIAGPGRDYPALGAQYAGTSVATAVLAATYARSLHLARQMLVGPSRLQADGVVATGSQDACLVASCPLADGILTAKELRTSFFENAAEQNNPRSTAIGGFGPVVPVAHTEFDYMSQGHGFYLGRLSPAWHEEAWRVVRGAQRPPVGYPPLERDWFLVDSYCRQKIWGTWRDGDFDMASSTLPPANPLRPVRTALTAACREL